MERITLPNKGFTLIEVIAVLVLGGILTALAGLGVVKVTEGLVFAQKAAATTLKAQMVLTRIEKELHIATSIASASTATSLTFVNNKGGGSATYTLCLNGAYIDLAAGSDCAGGDHFVDNVTSLAFTYLAADGATPAAPDAAKVIDMSFTLAGAGGTTSQFTMRVASRNL